MEETELNLTQGNITVPLLEGSPSIWLCKKENKTTFLIGGQDVV